MNGQVELVWRTLHTIAHSIMVHARVWDKYIHFGLMYTTHHIFIALPINHLIKQDGELTTSHKVVTGTKTSLSNICVLFFHVLYTKWLHVLTERRQTCVINYKRVFWVSLLEFYNNKKGNSSTYILHKNSFFTWCCIWLKQFSALAYTSHPYSEALTVWPAVLYIWYAISSHEQTGKIITFTQFKEGGLLEENLI